MDTAIMSKSWELFIYFSGRALGQVPVSNISSRVLSSKFCPIGLLDIFLFLI